MTITLHTVSVGGMVMFWATLHTPVHAAMLGQSGESSKTTPLGYRTEPLYAYIITIHNYMSCKGNVIETASNEETVKKEQS